MPRKTICNLSTEYLEKAYIDEGRSLVEMCDVIGVKSPITVGKILRSRGISTNNNERISTRFKNGMSDDEFEKYLRSAYESGKSIASLASEFGISHSGMRKYFIKYGIPRRSKSEQLACPFNNPNWKGGRIMHEGYVLIYCPQHPNANANRNVYEHQLVMEKHLGRYLKKGEVVHHIDGNKSNNDISNLLLLTNSDHAKLHAILRRSKKLMEKKTCSKE